MHLSANCPAKCLVIHVEKKIDVVTFHKANDIGGRHQLSHGIRCYDWLSTHGHEQIQKGVPTVLESRGRGMM